MGNFDYVIIGSGAAASVVAGRLAEDRRHTICVLEAGPLDSNRYIRIPAGYMKTRLDPKVTFQLHSEAIPGTAGRKVPIIQGRTVGGGSSINGMLYVRGQPNDFDGWAARGNPGWSYAEVLPYFKRTETRIGDADDRYCGRDGPLPIATPPYPHVLADAFMDSVAACGVPRKLDYNVSEQFGVGRFQAAIHKGRRVSAADAFLHPAVRHGRVELRTHAHASRIRFDGRRATGVDYLDGDGNTQSIDAKRGVIVSAGAIHSPKLLQLSGVGPAELLQTHGINVVHDLPGVGANLHDHYNVWHVYRARGASSLNSLASGLPLVGQVIRWLMGMPSILAVPPGLCYVFGKSDPSLADADFQLTFAPASLKHGALGLLDDFQGMTCGAWRHRPDSSGYIHIAGADPRMNPLINPMYFSDERDQRGTLAALKFVRKLFSTPPLSQFVDANVFPGPQVQSDDELLDFARRIGTGTYHLTGSCRMGPATDPGAVVDSRLSVHGMENLHVVDASIMPSEPSANTYAPSLMIGEKGADLILGKPTLPPEHP